MGGGGGGEAGEGGMLYEYRKLIYADGRYNDNIYRLPTCVEVF